MVPLCAGQAFRREYLSPRLGGDKALRVSKQDPLGMCLNLVTGEVFRNVAFKLGDLVDIDSSAVSSLYLAEHPRAI